MEINFPTALPGIEPRMPDPKSGVLPITPQGNILVYDEFFRILN
jgi:hypothetical protein